MWRYYYAITRNLPILPRLIKTMRGMIEHAQTHPEAYSEQRHYEYVRYIVDIMQRTSYIKTEGFGLENLPKEGGYMMYPNHQGKYDAYAIVAVHEQPCTVVMDKEKSNYIFVKEILDTIRGKRLDKVDIRQAAGIIREMSKEVAEGRRYILFPEGWYDNKKKHDLIEFKAGCFKIPLKSKVPIVPVALIDTYKVYNSWKIGTVTAQVHFLEPISYDEYKDMKTPQIAEMVKERIAKKIAEVTGQKPL